MNATDSKPKFVTPKGRREKGNKLVARYREWRIYARENKGYKWPMLQALRGRHRHVPHDCHEVRAAGTVSQMEEWIDRAEKEDDSA